MEALRQVTREVRQHQALLLLGGDFNASWLAEAIDIRASERPLRINRHLAPSMQRGADLLRWLDDDALLRVVLPDGGLRPTFTPYSADQQAKILDYVFCHGTPQRRSRVRALKVQSDWVLRTGRSALQVCITGLSALQAGGRRDVTDPLRFVKLNRTRRVRRRWPGWSESTPGQVSSLVPDATWSEAAHLQRALLWAGRAAAQKGRRFRHNTPFDPLERQALAERRDTRDRSSRRILALWIFEFVGIRGVGASSALWRSSQQKDRVSPRTCHRPASS